MQEMIRRGLIQIDDGEDEDGSDEETDPEKAAAIAAAFGAVTGMSAKPMAVATPLGDSSVMDSDDDAADEGEEGEDDSDGEGEDGEGEASGDDDAATDSKSNQPAIKFDAPSFGGNTASAAASDSAAARSGDDDSASAGVEINASAVLAAGKKDLYVIHSEPEVV